MHAILARQSGGPEVLEFAEVERPTPGPGQLLVKVAATGVNFIETYQRGGMYKVAYPFTPGSEAAGTVEEVGEGVFRLLLQRSLMQLTCGAEYVIRMVGRGSGAGEVAS